MPKRPLSVTLDEGNVLWLAGQAARRKKRSLSDTLDEIVTRARQGGSGAEAPRSVVGTIDIAADDPALLGADAAVDALFAESLSRPVLARDRVGPSASAAGPKGRRG